MATASNTIVGVEHWVTKAHASGPILLYAWEKYSPAFEGAFEGTALLIHGSSMASTPSFDLQLPGHPGEHSLMDYLAELGYDAWCFDCEGSAAPTRPATASSTLQTARTMLPR